MPFKLPLPPHPQKARKTYPEVVAAVVAVFELPLPAAVEVAAALLLLLEVDSELDSMVVGKQAIEIEISLASGIS